MCSRNFLVLQVVLCFLLFAKWVVPCPLKVSGLCKCQRWIDGLQLECSFIQMEEIISALVESGERVDKFQLHNSNIEVLKAGTFQDIIIKEINLAGNNISEVEAEAFQEQSETLESLSLANNTLEEFINITGLSRLQSIDLSGNKLTTIPDGVFLSTPNLKQLRLENNKICLLKRNVLEETKGFLELLDLSGNCLSSVPAQSLRGSQRLMYVDLSANRITSLPNLQFMNLPVLKEVRLSHNQIRALGSMAFMNVPNLQQLYLRNNSISILDPNRFQAFEKLQILDLSFNNILRIPTSSFKGMANLRQLFIDSNVIDSIETLAFSADPELQIISLQNNRIKNIFRNAFDSLPQMVTLLLVNNSLETIGRGALAGLQNLQQLSLRKNMIRTIETGALKALPELTTLDLGENQLSVVPQDAFRDLGKLFWLDLCCNGIQTFAQNTFDAKVKNILLHDNALVCDDGLDWFVTYLVSKGVRTFLPDQPEVVCAGPPGFNGTRLKDVMIKKANESFHNSFRQLTPGGGETSPLPLSNIIPALKQIPGLQGSGITGITDAIPGLSDLLTSTSGLDGLKAFTDPIFNGIAQGASVDGLKGAVENFAQPLAGFASGSASNPEQLTKFVGSIPGLIQHLPAGTGESIPGLPGIKLQDIPPDVLQHVLNGGSIPGIPQALLDNMVQGYMRKMALAAANARVGKESTNGVPTTTFLPPLDTLPTSIVQNVLQGKTLPGLTPTETSTIKNYYMAKITEGSVSPDDSTKKSDDSGAISGESSSFGAPRLVSAADLLGQLPRNFDLTVLPQSLLQQLASGKKVDLASIPKEVIDNIRKVAPDLVARLEGSTPAGQNSQTQQDTTNFLDILPPPRQTIIPEETFKPYDLDSLDRQNEIGDPSSSGDDNIPIYTGLGLAAVGVISAGIVGYLCYKRKISSAGSIEDLDRTKFFATSSPKTSFDSTTTTTATNHQGNGGPGVNPYDPYGRPSPSWVYSTGGLPDYRRTEMQTFQS